VLSELHVLGISVLLKKMSNCLGFDFIVIISVVLRSQIILPHENETLDQSIEV